jgi:hypothetical protein
MNQNIGYSLHITTVQFIATILTRIYLTPL